MCPTSHFSCSQHVGQANLSLRRIRKKDKRSRLLLINSVMILSKEQTRNVSIACCVKSFVVKLQINCFAKAVENKSRKDRIQN